MLRAIVICPDQNLSARLETALRATGDVTITRTLPHYPPALELMRAVRAHAPEVVFMSFEAVEKAQEIVRALESEAEGIQIVAVHQHLDARVLRETMRAGVREFLAEPFDRQAVLESLATIQSLVERKPVTLESTSQVFGFLPSKAGVGTSTLALNVSAAMARRSETRIILSDFDLNSGMLRFMLKLQNEYSVIDAAEHAPHMDENLWPQLVTTFDQLDVLHAGRVNPNLRIDGHQISALIDFMRRNYDAVCFDLSGNLERYSLEIMQDCKRVLLVCTPEIPSLHLAREKLTFLRTLDLAGRVSVVLNRVQKKGLFTKEQVEEILGVPVIRTFPNDYHGVNQALTQGHYIDPNTELGKAFAQFANELLERRQSASGDAKKNKKFIEFFAVQSSRALVPGQK